MHRSATGQISVKGNTGSCGMHDGPRRAVHKDINTGYFWPSMHQDADNEISSCDSCQVYATIPKLPKNDMIFVTLAWPFRKWGMNIVGPLPEALGKIKFGILATIIIDNGTQLINDPFKSSAKGLGIKLISTSEGGAWVEELPNVLWAHKTTPKTSNEETPFSLAYGTKAVIPAEIGIPIRRIIQRSDEENEEALRMNLNLLEERREIATIKEARRKQQLEKYYNQQVHHKQFKEEPYEVVETYGTGAYKIRSMEGHIGKSTSGCRSDLAKKKKGVVGLPDAPQ
ncbi:reverse transcriptase domain-containing protein [Tanacetum coccineum]